MPEKQVKPVAIRLGKDLSDKLQKTIDESCIAYNKQEFTMYAIRCMFDHIFYEFNITTDNKECDYNAVADALAIMDVGKREFDRAKGDQCQFIVRIPQELYDRIAHIGKILHLSIQDFIKGSIIFQMKKIEYFNEDYKVWNEYIQSIDLESFYNKICEIQQTNLMKK